MLDFTCSSQKQRTAATNIIQVTKIRFLRRAYNSETLLDFVKAYNIV